MANFMGKKKEQNIRLHSPNFVGKRDVLIENIFIKNTFEYYQCHKDLHLFLKLFFLQICDGYQNKKQKIHATVSRPGN